MKIPESFSKKKIIRETFFAVLAGIFGIAVISIFTHNWNFLSMIRSFKPELLILSFIMMICNWLLEAYTLQIISNSLNYNMKFSESLYLFLIGGFFSRITPFGGGGGEPVQMVVLAQSKKIKPGDSAAIIAIKMFIGTFVRLSVFIFIPLWLLIAKPSWGMTTKQNVLINAGIALTVLLFSLLIAALLRPQIAEGIASWVLKLKVLKKILREKQIIAAVNNLKKTVNDFREARAKIFKANQKMITYAFAASFVIWGLILFTPVVLMRGLGITSPWPEIVITAIIFYISSAYIPTPGGSGTSEIEILALFSRLIPSPLIGVFIITWRVFTHYLLLIFGGFVTLLQFKRKPKPQ